MLAARWACCSSTAGWWSLIGSSIRRPPGWADGPSGPCVLGSGLAILVLHLGSGRILPHDRAQGPRGPAQQDAHRDLGDNPRSGMPAVKVRCRRRRRTALAAVDAADRRPRPNPRWPSAGASCYAHRTVPSAQGADAGRAVRRRPAGASCATPVRLAVALAAPDLERDDDLRYPAEQGEEPNPQQQERPAGGEQLLGGPEAEHELQDADHQAEPPGAADFPGHEGGDDVERALEDEQQPQHGGEGPEGAEGVDERPD